MTVIRLARTANHAAGDIMCHKFPEVFALDISCGAESLIQNISHDEAKKLRDALIGFYPLEEKNGPRVTVVHNIDTNKYEVIQFTHLEKQTVRGSFTDKQDADRFFTTIL